MLSRILIAGAGGFVGTALRYAAGLVAERHLPAAFPWGTFLVNVTGCFVIGVLAVLADERAVLGPEARLFLIVGVLGGYTTFSSFGYETTLLLRGGATLQAAANVVGQVVLGLLAVACGAAAARAAS